MIILIADDDRLIRFTMKSMLNNILDSSHQYIEASNGLELIDRFNTHTPDIAFIDIKMPYMDGITAIENVQQLSPLTEFVIISGYSDFAYAQRCISLNVKDYLLKPVTEEELYTIISVLEKNLAYTHRETNSRFKLHLLNSFNSFSTIGIDAEHEEPTLTSSEHYYAFGLFINSPKAYRNECATLQKNLIQCINKFGSSLINPSCHYSLIYSNEGSPYFIFKASELLETTILDTLKKTYTLSLNPHYNVNMIYFKVNSFQTLYNACNYWDTHHYLCMNSDNNFILTTHALKLSPSLDKALSFIHTLLLAYQNTDEIHYKEALNHFYNLDENTIPLLNLRYIANYIYRFTNFTINYTNHKAFCQDLKNRSKEIYTSTEKSEYNLIDEIKHYIQKNYMSDISISQIANQFNLTPNYLSNIFHQKANCKLIDYITEIRIANAKRLLVKNTTASVKDITVMVGYTSSRHFSTLFQKTTGQTPSAYRKTFLA